MDQRVKNLWLEELRSGRHEQTTGVLCDVEGRKCCLGVLTDIAVREGVLTGQLEYTMSDEYAMHYGEHGEALTLPYEVQDWAGLPDDSPSIPLVESDDYGFEGRSHLTTLNDRNRWNFNQIADAIEEHL